MEQDDIGTPSSPDKISPLTVDAPPGLLAKLLAPLGLQPSTPDLPAPSHNLQFALKSLQWAERVSALQELSKRATPLPVELIIEAVHDENAYVRAAAIRALENTQDQAVVPPLLSALTDTSWSVRAAAAHTLGKLGSHTAIDPLIARMHDDTDEAVRAASAAALGQMKNAVPLQPLLQALHDSRWLVREAAVSALGSSGQPVPRASLLAASQDPDLSVREAALLALQRIYPDADSTTIARHPTQILSAQETIDQRSTQLLPAQENTADNTLQNSQRLFSLWQTMRHFLSNIHRLAAFNSEQETIQYLPLPSASLPSSRSSGRLLLSVLSTGATVLVVVAIIFASFVLFRPRPSASVGSRSPTACPLNLVTSTDVGCSFFKSSLPTTTAELNAGQGINDIFEIDLANVPAPAPGKSYYAWLSGSPTNPEGTTVLLHQLTVAHGNIHYVYQDPQHIDLLAGTDVFLITEEATDPQPIVPSLDHSTWRYYDALSQTPDPHDTTNHYSIFDHLHHLLSADPQLETLNLHGGLGIWLQRNSQALTNLSQEAYSAFRQHNAQALRIQLVDMLAYLDSSVYVYQDIPAGTVVHLDPVMTRVALLTFNALNQVPSGYLQHIAYHLNGIAANPYATPFQKKLATDLTDTLSLIEAQFQQIRTIAKSLVHMSNAQLLQAASGALLNTLVTQTAQVYQGQMSMTTHAVQQDGVVQLYQAMQTLAAFAVHTYK
jgi:hypothetical protein